MSVLSHLLTAVLLRLFSLLLSMECLFLVAAFQVLYLGIQRWGSPWPTFMLVLLGSLLWLSRWKWGRRMPKWQYFLELALALSLAFALSPSQEEAPLPEEAKISGTVLEVQAEGHYLLNEVKLLGEGKRPLKTPILVLSSPFPPPPLGKRISVDVDLRTSRSYENPSTVFPYPSRAFGEAYSEAEILGNGGVFSRIWIKLSAELTLESGSAQALYRALILGDRRGLESDTRHAFQDTGTAHLLAISGMHLALLGWGLFACILFLSLRLPFLIRWAQNGNSLRASSALLAALLMLFYGQLISPSHASLRALIAFSFVASSFVLSRKTELLHTVKLCALFILILEPDAAFQAGFQLSFAAVFSLALSASPLSKVRAQIQAMALPTWLKKTLIWALMFSAASLVTSFATLGIGLAWFGQMPLHGLWVNLIAIPLMTVLVLPLGVVCLVFFLVLPPLKGLLSPLMSFTGDGFLSVISWIGDWIGPSSTASWPLLYALLLTFGYLLLFRRHSMKWGLSLMFLAMFFFALHQRHDKSLSMVALDVGHGDALALTLPEGQRVLVDVGGRLQEGSNQFLAERVTLPALLSLGFESLDLVVVTHPHQDHAGGLLRLAKRIGIKALWLPPCAGKSPLMKEVTRLVKAQGGEVIIAASGAPFDWGGASFEILWPPSDMEEDWGCSHGPNDSSLVLRIGAYGKHMLLTGDIEEEAELALLEKARHEQRSLQAELLKSPHHGSKSSSHPLFLDAVKPDYVVVSGQRHSAPMPPHESVLQRYQKRQIKACVTSDLGAITSKIFPSGELQVVGMQKRSCGEGQSLDF